MKSRTIFLLIGLLALLASSCQPTKRLQEGELLYTGADLSFEGEAPVLSKSELLADIQQQPNNRVLGLPVRLGIYNTFGKKGKGIGKWIRDKLGEPPVVYDKAKSDFARLRIETWLKREGYLQAEVGMDSSTADRKVKVHYAAKPGSRYQLVAVDWPADSSAIGQWLQGEKEGSPLSPGQPYCSDLLKGERERLAEAGRQQGFYGLSADYFYYFLDTLSGQHEACAYLRLVDDPPGQPYQRHYIGQTTVHPVYFLGAAPTEGQDTVLLEGVRYIQPQPYVQLKRLNQALLQDKGEQFSQVSQQKSVNRLMALGTYKFVNLDYELREQGDSLFLDRQFFLTPNLPQDFAADLEASTLSTASSSVNAGVSVKYTHRNLFGGAEQFSTRLSADAATQLGQSVDFINNVNLQFEGKLRLPGLVAPFGWLRAEQSWQSNSEAKLRADFQRRINFFSIFSISGSWGYEWQPSRLHRYRWQPFQLTRVNLLNSTERFEERLAANPRLREGFQDYLIASTVFEYRYSEEQPGRRKNYLVMSGLLEPAGNLSYLLSTLLRSEPEGSYSLLGQPFAQFLRIEGSIARHWFVRKSEWAARLQIGAALPYLNSGAVPYIRQFFVGGSNSIRAWQIRALGPGAVPVSEVEAQTFQDQTGDIKLELNMEYRFPIISYLKGAAFVDAGNIWLASSEAAVEEQEGLFRWGEFYRQIAVGSGLGLRLDVTFFVLRLDVAFPLRKPYLPQGERWVFEDISFGQKGWRQRNLVYNLALGYPF